MRQARMLVADFRPFALLWRQLVQFRHLPLQAFALELLEHEHIILVPGSSFNIAERNRFRVTMLPEPAVLADAFARIERQLERCAESGAAQRRVA